MPSLNKRERFITLPYRNNIFAATLVVFYYAFYRYHVELWRYIHIRDAENIPVLSVRPYPKTSSSLKGAIRKRNFHELIFICSF
jgi:hypothetical protein